MDITDYKLLKWKCIKGKYLYLLETPLKHYAVVLHDTDDFTVLKSQFEWDYVEGLHTYNKWKEELLTGTEQI